MRYHGGTQILDSHYAPLTLALKTTILEILDNIEAVVHSPIFSVRHRFLLRTL